MNKLSVTDYQTDCHYAKSERMLIIANADMCTRDCEALTNWVDKYLPLRVHHNMSELLEDFVTPDLKNRFKDVSRLMGNSLRKEILNDNGFSSLKKRALDLITGLKLDQNLLNEQKTKEREERIVKRGSNLNATQ